MLVRDVAAEFGGNVKVSIEEYGHSPMAERFGVRRYPVVFVDDVLFARPKDFGFGGADDVSGGVYVPWLEPANQRRFKDDLRRAVRGRLAGEAIAGHDVAEVTEAAAGNADGGGPSAFPGIALHDIAGKTLDPAPFAGRAVVVEMWATWCPPCRSTLAWLPELQKKYGDELTIVSIAIDSPQADVAALAQKLGVRYPIVMGTPDVVSAFGAVAAVPKLLVFDRRGARARVLYGAPPDLHQQIEAAVREALGRVR